MRVVVSGVAGPVVSGIVSELLRRGHKVRLAVPNATEHARRWSRVEAFDAIGGAAGGSDAIVHCGHWNVAEMIEEAQRESGFRRFAYVVAAAEDSDTESHFADSRLGWTVICHAPVYGPGDDVVSPILKLVRMLPVVPVSEGNQHIRPLWFEDLAKAVVVLVERRDTARRTFEIAGSAPVTLNDLVDRLRKITARNPLRVPVPGAIDAIAATLPQDTLRSPIVLRDLGIDEMPLDRGLRIMADSLPEQLLEHGLGRMHHKRFWADIRGSRYSPEALMTIFRDRVNEIMPIEFVAEPGAASRIEKGATMTMALPLRGHAQIRVERSDPTAVVFATIEGHPIAGMVEFTTRELPGGVIRFAIDNFSRAGHLLDYLALRTVGELPQSANWRVVVQNMIAVSGGTSDGVLTESRVMSDDSAIRIERNLRELVERRAREMSAPEGSA